MKTYKDNIMKIVQSLLAGIFALLSIVVSINANAVHLNYKDMFYQQPKALPKKALKIAGVGFLYMICLSLVQWCKFLLPTIIQALQANKTMMFVFLSN